MPKANLRLLKRGQSFAFPPARGKFSRVTKAQLSIALCTHNSAAFLAPQLDSFLAQTLPATEVIAVDDHSADNTLSLLATYEGRLPIKLFRNEQNLGFVKSFERALSLCTGEYIFLSDHDDLWDPTKIESLLAAFTVHPEAAVAFSDARLIEAKGDLIADSFWAINGFSEGEQKLFIAHKPSLVLFRKAVAAGNSMAVRKDFLRLALPIPEGWCHDEWILALAACLSEIALVMQPMLSYRQHGSQAIGAAGTGVLTRLSRRWKRAEARSFADFANDLKKWEKLEERVNAVGILSSKRKDLLRKKIDFHRRCALYARFRPLRAFQIVGQLYRGNYTNFVSGFSSALRDGIARSNVY